MMENSWHISPDKCLRSVKWKSSAVLAPRKLHDEGGHKRSPCRNDQGMVRIAQRAKLRRARARQAERQESRSREHLQAVQDYA